MGVYFGMAPVAIFLRNALYNKLRSKPKYLTFIVSSGKLPQTPRAKKVIEFATEEAIALNHKYVDTEHFLLGLLRETNGVAIQVLINLGLKLEDIRQEVMNLIGVGIEKKEEPEQEQEPAEPWPTSPSGHNPNEGKCGWNFAQGYKEHIKRSPDAEEEDIGQEK